LRAGGSDYPMKLLSRAGVDLSRPDTVRSVATELDMLVGRLEEALSMA
jgi:oligoendopeptidase F